MPSKPGRKAGPGLPKGYKFKHTLEREAARRHLEARIIEELDPLIQAQFDVAKGVMVMFAREKNGEGARVGKLYRVTSPEEMLDLLNSDGQNGVDYYYLSAKDPDGKVLENLMCRVFGKPKETVEVQQPGEAATVADILRKLDADAALDLAQGLLAGAAVPKRVN